MKTALIICGALAREVMEIVRRHGWDVDVVGVSALDHLFPERIAPDVEGKILAVREQYERVVVVYGDCGSKGALDATLARHGVERVAGPHCYEMYGGPLFEELLAEEPGTFFLTDFLVRSFNGAVVKGLGLDRFPKLKDAYFRNYTRVVYMAQTRDPALEDKARKIGGYLGFPLEIRYTGLGLLEERLVALMSVPPAATLSPVSVPGENGRAVKMSKTRRRRHRRRAV